MKMKRLLVMVLLGMMSVFLVSCGTKSGSSTQSKVQVDKNGIPLTLKDKYKGYSENSGYEHPFEAGGDVLTFDKKERTITNSQGDKTYFSVLDEKDIPDKTKGVLTSIADDLYKDKNITIIVSQYDKFPTKKNAEAVYEVSLNKDGSKIKIFELRRGHNSDNRYYTFSGQVD